jgi:dolichol-phosphate mannosyltransferase
MKISVVSPVYKAENIVGSLVSQIAETVVKITPDYEIILVNDCSPDNSWEKILENCRKNKKVKGLNLSRNFGQHYAISAGLSVVSGDWIVVMDCDLQDVPSEITKLYSKAEEGYDIVYARRVNRRDKFLKRLSSAAFHKVFNILSGLKSDKTIANFGIYSRRVIDEYNKMGEKARTFTSLISYIGFPASTVDVSHSERPEGKSSYTLLKLLRLSLDVIIANTNRPLHIAVNMGFLISIVSFLLAFYNVIANITGLIVVPGYTTTVFSIWFVGGLIMMMLGILGLYIEKIFTQVKDRQLFIIQDRVNFGNE